MSFLTLLFAETAWFALPFELTKITAILWPLLGLAAIAALLMLFKPLLSGILHAALLLMKPRKSLEQRIAEHNATERKLLHRKANDQDGSQVAIATDLRLLRWP
ncbi:hypothetical protein [Glaciimonas soli]|uniref:Uncharacterized protein n=1 Tax=Glaciimonas soli TaxID=2590999 RepID=A0A843YU96_9BURK|nr:hypothetical protein [Glaciimonas soli]MQR01068.1 hypothetical protein [Glaciimonas soli]